MKAILLAAGKSTRLKKTCRNTPKPMLKVKGEIILEHNLEWLIKFGVTEIYINLHYLPDVIKSHFKNGNAWDIQIKYAYEKNILGTAGGVKNMIKLYRHDDWEKDLLVVYGDNFYHSDYNIEEMKKFHLKKKALITIGFYHRKIDPHQGGIALLDSNYKVKQFIEKPEKGEIKSDLVNAGIYLLNRKVLEYIPDGFSDFSRDIFPVLLKKKWPIYGYIFDKGLIPIDTPKLFLRANN